MSDPVLRSVHVHPVKSLRALDRAEAEVEPWGLAHDRRWAVVDARGTVMTQRRHPRLALATAEPLADGGLRLTGPGREPLVVAVPEPSATLTADIFDKPVETVPAGEAAAAWFSAFLEADARLVHLDAPEHRRPVDPAYALPGETVSLADGYPLLVASAASLDALNGLIARGDHAAEGPLPMSRFRPNLVVGGTEPWAEDGWTRLTVGEVTFRVAKPCGRCVVTTTDQTTAERGKEPLRTLAAHRRRDGKLVFGQNLIPEHRGTVRVGDPVKILD
ncbi:MOSC domain-containing protein [Streptomyces sp. NPDC014861]|uniref:MOSC domain-containing protein n=1 Tax=Streptomyces sp. NPDC014861 TaxID=3364923 RepID=UPI003702C850